MQIIFIVGSLRRESFNLKLAKVAAGMLPEGVTGEVATLHDIPLYDTDLEAEWPVAATTLREKIRGADGVVIVTPEYNYSFSGVLKNALDWISRPPATQPFNGKPTAIMGASGGLYGTVRAQGHLRQVLQFLNAATMPKPEFLLGQAQTKFDAEGNLNDAKAKEQLGKFMEEFVRKCGSV